MGGISISCVVINQGKMPEQILNRGRQDRDGAGTDPGRAVSEPLKSTPMAFLRQIKEL